MILTEFYQEFALMNPFPNCETGYNDSYCQHLLRWKSRTVLPLSRADPYHASSQVRGL